MSRPLRIKYSDAIYHIMVRSISEVNLFGTNDDKDMYMDLIKKYKTQYKFKVYEYCLMDNHGHFVIDANGADISDIMHSINFSYAQKYNSKHSRHGHLFQDRFKSKIIDTDNYLVTVSAYIHNNPLDIKEYKDCPEKYYYSSLGVYLGMREDPFRILDDSFILSFFGENSFISRINYKKFIFKCSEIKEEIEKEIEFKNEKTEYKSGRKILVRNYNAENIIDFISGKFGISKCSLHTKYSRKVVEARALLSLLMRSMCNFKCCEICGVLGNITSSRVSKLCSIGGELIDNESRYSKIVEEFIECYS